MYTLSYDEALQDRHALARGLPPRTRKFQLTARLHYPFYTKDTKAVADAYAAFRHFTKPGQSHKFFDIEALKEELGGDFNLSVNFIPVTGRPPRGKKVKSVVTLGRRPLKGFCAVILVEAKDEKDATDECIAPLLNAISAAADRAAHDRQFGAFMQIGETVPVIKSLRPRPRRSQISDGGARPEG